MTSEEPTKLVRILRKQLERSEADRAELEITKEKNDALLRTVILDLRASQEELNAKSEELQNTLVELNAAQEELIQSAKMVALGELVAGIAHEINTPLGVSVTAASHLDASAKAMSKLLDSNELTMSGLRHYVGDAEESVDMILRNLSRASDIVQNFKQISVDRSFEEGRDFFVLAYLEEVMKSISVPIRKRKIETTLDGPQDLKIFSDPGLIAQVMTNLVMNSLVHAYADISQEGHISIEFWADGDWLCIKYQDDGCGIDRAHIDRIFNPFFTTRRGRGGSGLGLSIVHSIVVQKLNGTIRCESERGVGTSFLLRLPGLKQAGAIDHGAFIAAQG